MAVDAAVTAGITAGGIDERGDDAAVNHPAAIKMAWPDDQMDDGAPVRPLGEAVADELAETAGCIAPCGGGFAGPIHGLKLAGVAGLVHPGRAAVAH